MTTNTTTKPKPKPKRDAKALIGLARAAELLDLRHDYLVKAIEKGHLRAVEVEYPNRAAHIVTAGALRLFRDAEVKRLQERGTPRRLAWAESLAEREV